MKYVRFVLIPTLATLVLAPAASAQQRAGAEQLGKVHFSTSCSAAVQGEFDRAVALLHSFWLDAATKAFTDVAQKDPGCGIAYWGVAIAAYGNPFTWPPSPQALADGRAAVEKAKNAGARTPRERDYIGAIETFYKDSDGVDHRTRALAYLKAMEQLSQRYPEDREAAIFYALALNATAVPTDKTYAQQLKAAAILEKIFAEQPHHPGVAHYLIHSYDYPPIAHRGLDAARRYASIAPSAPHALHMPAHIFTRRGYWQESIASNRASAASTKNHMGQLHAMDYLAYAHLQLGQDAQAKQVLDDVRALGKINVEHFVSGYALAAIPARYALERGRWAEAAGLTLSPSDFPWGRFPQAEAVLSFARGLGAARSGDVLAARQSVERLQALRDALATAKNAYWAEQVDIQQRAVAGWIAHAETKQDEALAILRAAANMEAGTEKHPVTPGPLVPARELLGELLLELNQPAQALREFEATLRTEPNRFRTVYGAARAAELSGDTGKARTYYNELVALGRDADAERPELQRAKAFLARR
jgi:hypothetical protein